MLDLTAKDTDALLRLAAAAVIGMVIGINRDLRGKPTGMRTLGLVCMGAALVSLTAIRVGDLADHPDAMSRVVQGIVQGVLTGIGFLGAGVVLRDRDAMEVHGLTTAATVWVTAALGIAAALASGVLIATGLVIALALLAVATPLEKMIERHGAARRARLCRKAAARLHRDRGAPAQDPPPAAATDRAARGDTATGAGEPRAPAAEKPERRAPAARWPSGQTGAKHADR